MSNGLTARYRAVLNIVGVGTSNGNMDDPSNTYGVGPAAVGGRRGAHRLRVACA